MEDPIAALRRDYRAARLDVGDVATEPFAQFHRWFAEARKATHNEANAMTLATASPEGLPSARMVLLKDLDAEGFVFYTNYASNKAHTLDANPRAALVFHWNDLERQVRIEGRVEKVSEAESDAYFAVRPRGSQLGAWASPQSEIVADRAALEAAYAEAETRFAGGDVPRPRHWGGYRVVPERVEFWQGRTSRLHDRLRYVREADGWRLERLAP